MTDPRDLRFPAPSEGDDAADLVSRLQISYAATPVPSAEHAARVAAAIVRQAGRDLRHEGHGATGERGHPRWWWGMAAAAALAVLVLRPWRDPSGSDGRTTATSAAAPALSGATVEVAGAVRFDLTLPTAAKQVALVGDFNGWSETATPMVRRGRDGTWSASVPLPPGRHTYAFVVDGTRWLVDPLAPQVPGSDFGPTNAVVVERAGSERPDSGTEP